MILEKDLKKQKNVKKMKNENGEAITPKSKMEDISPVLLSGGVPIESSTSIEDALKLADLTLKVGSDSFRCVINPPRIKDLTLTIQPMAGYYTYADAVVADAELVNYEWFIGLGKKGLDSDKIKDQDLELLQAAVERCCTKKGVVKPINFSPIEQTSSPRLRVEKEHVGKIICCIAKPVGKIAQAGLSFGATSKQPVQSGPGLCPYRQRQENEIDKLENDEFRVCSYNILSDALAETEFSKEGLFPYCDDEYVAWSYREHLLLDEIIGYRSSLIALQELDGKRYKS